MSKAAFKKLTSMIESDSNPDVIHPKMKSTMHKGTKAIGEYGLMPITAKDIVASKKNKDPLDEVIGNIDPTMIEEVLQDNPDKYNELIDSLMGKIVNKTIDPVDASVMWRWGQNLSPERIENIKQENPEFLRRVEDKIREGALSSKSNNYIDTLKTPEQVLYSKIRNKIGVP
jgi:hypothetical protein